MEKTLILKHISGMLCLLISYSKFTRPSSLFTLKNRYARAIINIMMCDNRIITIITR